MARLGAVVLVITPYFLRVFFCLLVGLTLTTWGDHLFEGAPLVSVSSAQSNAFAPGSPRIGVALSGGGHRAAALHAGTLFELELRGIPVTHLSVVSGGSLIGTYYALGGRPEAFLEHEISGAFSVRREALHLEFLIPGRLKSHATWFTGAHSRQLSQRLTRSLTLATWERTDLPRHLLIGTTDLFTGDLIGFAHETILRCPIETLQSRVQRILDGTDTTVGPSKEVPRADLKIPDQAPLSDFVAASCAIPGIFVATRFGTASNPLVLADGGVSDGSGLRLLLEADFRARTDSSSRLRDWALDGIIASDGSFTFLHDDPQGVIEQLGRSLSIMQANGSSAGLDRREILARVPPKPLVSLTPDFLLDKIVADGFISEESLQQTMHFKFESSAPKAIAYSRLPQETQAAFLAVTGAAPAESANTEAAYQAVSKDLARSLLVFYRTPTTTDRLDRKTADALFRLGRYLVLLKSAQLETLRQLPQEHQTSHEDTKDGPASDSPLRTSLQDSPGDRPQSKRRLDHAATPIEGYRAAGYRQH